MKVLVLGPDSIGLKAAQLIHKMMKTETAFVISIDTAAEPEEGNKEALVRINNNILTESKSVAEYYNALVIEETSRKERRKKSRKKEKMRKRWLGHGINSTST